MVSVGAAIVLDLAVVRWDELIACAIRLPVVRGRLLMANWVFRGGSAELQVVRPAELVADAQN